MSFSAPSRYLRPVDDLDELERNLIERGVSREQVEHRIAKMRGKMSVTVHGHENVALAQFW